MDRKAWQKKHGQGLTIYQWVISIPSAVFVIMSDLPFWEELIGLLVINASLNLGGTYLAWVFASDGRKAQR